MPKGIGRHRKIVVKVGSSSLTHDTGRIDLWRMERLVRQISNLQNAGYHVILVSSGAIAAGMGKMQLEERPKSIPEKQAAAAVGQSTLMHLYEKFFSEYGITVAQILLTREDMENSVRKAHCINAVDQLIKRNIVPIVNENDVVAVDEIKVGDNDTLSALLCVMLDFDALVILSDIDGVYNKDPRTHVDAIKLDVIDSLETIDAISAGDTQSNVGTGGMATKLSAAKLLHSASKDMLIANSNTHDVLISAFQGDIKGTYFSFSKRNMI